MCNGNLRPLDSLFRRRDLELDEMVIQDLIQDRRDTTRLLESWGIEEEETEDGHEPKD